MYSNYHQHHWVFLSIQGKNWESVTEDQEGDRWKWIREQKIFRYDKQDADNDIQTTSNVCASIYGFIPGEIKLTITWRLPARWSWGFSLLFDCGFYHA